MLSDLGRRPLTGNNEKPYGDNFEMAYLLGDQNRQEASDRERELNMYRSGSAPPTVEGSLNAIGGLFNHGDGGVFVSDKIRIKAGNGFLTEDDLRSDPSYSSYYYSNVNLNPRLPPPLLSKENSRFAQRLQVGNSVIGDRRNLSWNESKNDGKTFSQAPPPGFNSMKQEIENDNAMLGSLEWENDGLSLPGFDLSQAPRGLTDIFHDGLNRSIHPDSTNCFDDKSSALGSTESNLAFLHTSSHSKVPASYSHNISLGGSISRSSTPDPQCIARVPSPCPGTIGGSRAGYLETIKVKIPSTYSDESADMVNAFSSMKFSNEIEDENHSFPTGTNPDDNMHYLFNREGQNDVRQQSLTKDTEHGHGHLNMPSKNPANVLYPDSRMENTSSLDFNRNNSTHSSQQYRKASSGASRNVGGGLPSQHGYLDSPNSSFSNHSHDRYIRSTIPGQRISPNLPPLFENAVGESAGMDTRMLRGLSHSSMGEQNLNRMGNQMAGSVLQSPFMDPLYLQYQRAAEYASTQVSGLNDPSIDINYMGNSYMDMFQKAQLANLLSTQKSQYTALSSMNPHGYFGSPTFGISYPGGSFGSPVATNSFGLPASSLRHGDYNHNLGGMRSFSPSGFGAWHIDNMDNKHGSSLLEEFKSNKTRYFELSEISGHIVEFSVDQYGSRFIQQKLETATTEEKNMVFEEIFPEALTLVTDVFGNYVIQKFFEHGLINQRRDLASKLFGSVLTLSLQMYGCRVIQKAIEVVDIDQKIEMVKGLDGHVMRCVRDQNGNHVIQKCIECVPEEHIEFIVSTFFNQVLTLSTHPYGCRVIQRVLEHCENEKTQRMVMEEILGSVTMLAQDQYGNYVVQHVLEHGKPCERTTIIKELSGKIVEMSQQKFASNVIEKCLTFGDFNERQLLVNEIIGSRDENESLQVMMKDQFANYVVQKVLEICSDKQRELILTRIKVHLNALKKYTYGKHIVARVEKLVAAGERRIGCGQYLNSI